MSLQTMKLSENDEEFGSVLPSRESENNEAAAKDGEGNFFSLF